MLALANIICYNLSYLMKWIKQMNEIYLLEQCPRGKQDLQKIVNNIKLMESIKNYKMVFIYPDTDWKSIFEGGTK